MYVEFAIDNELNNVAATSIIHKLCANGYYNNNNTTFILHGLVRKLYYWLKPELIEGPLHGQHCQILSGEKPWDFTLEESSPYFALAATWN